MSESRETSALIDPNDPAGAKALGKLDGDLIAWFTTVDRSGEPRAVPVWFLWHDGRLLVTSEPETLKVARVRAGSPVLMHLESGEFGNDVVIVRGDAAISERSAAEWLPEIRDAYEAKYAEAMDDYGMGLDEIVQKFTTVIVVTPTKITAW
jgi:PPOX class probable F420-dependent enzyme